MVGSEEDTDSNQTWNAFRLAVRTSELSLLFPNILYGQIFRASSVLLVRRVRLHLGRKRCSSAPQDEIVVCAALLDLCCLPEHWTFLPSPLGSDLWTAVG